MFTCSKTYADIPFAHRQHKHDGHCAFVHGHNWTITITFSCRQLDPCGFVVDFGKLKYLRDWIDDHLDHAILLNRDDPHRDAILGAGPGIFKPLIIECCSSEGIAKFLYETFDPMVRADTGDRAWIAKMEILEDQKNAAAYAPGSRDVL